MRGAAGSTRKARTCAGECPQIVTKQCLPSAEMLRIVNETDPPAAAYAPH
ncbi:hypothetical protein ABT330_06575 [Streptomyces sp. NPDC000658]